MKLTSDKKIICQWCGHLSELIWVHGHGQCSVCGINIDECCRGEFCEFQNEENIETPDD